MRRWATIAAGLALFLGERGLDVSGLESTPVAIGLWSAAAAAMVMGAAMFAVPYIIRLSVPSRVVPISPGEELLVVEPVDGATVSSRFRVRGYANVMEGNVIVEDHSNGRWEIVGNGTAALGTDTLFGFSIDVRLKPGAHRLRVCAEPFMSDERSEECIELSVTVV